ncbi:MAG: SurA N-terminal domain-containing protein [Endomicrobia bacterium]|nr:SurA N-terminal domain-containing protein [Endomicrobiia bacterium]
MMNFLRKHMRKIFIVTILAFIGGTFMGFGAYLRGTSADTAAVVDGHKIPMKLYRSLYNASQTMYEEYSKAPLTEDQQKQIMAGTLQAVIQDEVLYLQAQKYGVLVSDSELRSDLQSSAMFKSNNNFDIRLYYSFLNKMHMSPKEFEEMRRKQIAGEKLKAILQSAIKVSESEYLEALEDNPKLLMDDMLKNKINRVLSEWYMKTARSYNITTNEAAFKQ